MILVDTSVWVEHLRHGNERLQALLLEEQVLCHPFVIGEISCGRIQNPTEILELLRALPRAEPVEHEEALRFVETHDLMGSGLGWVDVHLLASARLASAAVWTLDGPLKRAEERLREA